MTKIRSGARVLGKTVESFVADDGPSMAAALSFYSVFSLPPLLMVLMIVVGSVIDPDRVRDLLAGQVGGLLGPDGGRAVETFIRNTQRPELRGATALIGVVGFLLGATASFAQLQAALNTAWQVAPDPARGGLRNFILKRFASFGMVLAVGFLLIVSLALSAGLTAFEQIVNAAVPAWVSAGLLQAANALVSLLVIGGVFALLFRYVPDAVVRWRHAVVGGAFTAALFTVGKTAIGLYLGRSDPGTAFGAAGSLAVGLLWIYYTGIIVLLGAEFTQAWAAAHGAPIVPERGAVRIERRVARPSGGAGRS